MAGKWWQMGFLALAVALTAGCNAGKDVQAYTVPVEGSPQHGRFLLVKYKCGSCHMIPGIGGANGQFGPPLQYMGLRTYIAGEITNTPENLARWIQDPQALKPKTAMPDLGLNQQEATDVAAYIESLR